MPEMHATIELRTQKSARGSDESVRGVAILHMRRS